jgi:hypothetical protein
VRDAGDDVWRMSRAGPERRSQDGEAGPSALPRVEHAFDRAWNPLVIWSEQARELDQSSLIGPSAERLGRHFNQVTAAPLREQPVQEREAATGRRTHAAPGGGDCGQVPDGDARGRGGRPPLACLAVQRRIGELRSRSLGARSCPVDEQGGIAEAGSDGLAGPTDQTARVVNDRTADELEGLRLVTEDPLRVEQLGARPYEQVDRDAADLELREARYCSIHPQDQVDVAVLGHISELAARAFDERRRDVITFGLLGDRGLRYDEW